MLTIPTSGPERLCETLRPSFASYHLILLMFHLDMWGQRSVGIKALQLTNGILLDVSDWRLEPVGSPAAKLRLAQLAIRGESLVKR